jgi:uncharacterized protein YdhG (YjbR/CyaY superfamily)
MTPPRTVDQYIRAAPIELQPVLRKVRLAIQQAAPDSVESISYGMPFYSFRGEVGIERRLCYFGIQGTNLRLYFRPRDLEPHAQEIARYRSSKSALRFSVDEPIPRQLVKKIVSGADQRHRAGKAR